ncbi:hypothetical protein QEN19_000921 [Hanseniaspora menglaensis]
MISVKSVQKFWPIGRSMRTIRLSSSQSPVATVTSKMPTFIDNIGNQYIPPNIEKYVTKEYYPENLPKSLKKEIDEYLLNFRMINNKDWKNLTLLEQQKLYFLEYGKIGIRDPEHKMTKEAYIYKLIFQVLLVLTILTAFTQLYKDKNYLKKLNEKDENKD